MPGAFLGHFLSESLQVSVQMLWLSFVVGSNRMRAGNRDSAASRLDLNVRRVVGTTLHAFAHSEMHYLVGDLLAA